MENLYDIIGVSPSVSDEELDSAYKKLREKYGEERFQNGPAGEEAADKLEKLERAYSEIKRARSEYKSYGQDSEQAYAAIEEVLKNGGAVKEFKMDAQTVLGSPRVVLSAADVQDLVRKEFPNATFTKVKLDSDDGLYEYELKFYTPELRGEMKFNPENGALMEKELKYQVR